MGGILTLFCVKTKQVTYSAARPFHCHHFGGARQAIAWRISTRGEHFPSGEASCIFPGELSWKRKINCVCPRL